jgi:2-methylisocitrate lyase-like PEP mutase family enzyme
MTGAKSIFASKGVWGGAIAVLAGMAGFFGFAVTSSDTSEITSHIDSILAAVGGLLAVYGRITANKTLV